MAQETDWMDKLEKQLRRSPKMAADAEEMSEELDVSISYFLRKYKRISLASVLDICI